MPKTRVFKSKNDQYQVTIPKALAESLDLEKKKVEWSVVSSRSLKLTVVDDE